MYDFRDTIDFKTMHHAQCYVGNVHALENSLYDFLETSRQENDLVIHRYSFPVLTIDDVRTITAHTRNKSSQHQQYIFLVSFSQAPIEAQNALLKSIEEPIDGVYFIFIIPESSLLLPTILSRVQLHEISEAFNETSIRISVTDFLDAPLEDKLKNIEKVTKDKKDPFTRMELMVFLKTLEQEIENRGVKDYVDFLPHLYAGKKYAQLSGCSIKMILEFLAVSLIKK